MPRPGRSQGGEVKALLERARGHGELLPCLRSLKKPHARPRAHPAFSVLNQIEDRRVLFNHQACLALIAHSPTLPGLSKCAASHAFSTTSTHRKYTRDHRWVPGLRRSILPLHPQQQTKLGRLLLGVIVTASAHTPVHNNVRPCCVMPRTSE